jgi:hypothetical protein
MSIWLIITIAAVWIFLSGVVLVSVCMLSSRLSQAEETQLRRLPHEMTTAPLRLRGEEDRRTTQPRGNLANSPTG